VKEARNLVIKLDGRALIIEIDISEEDLITTLISSLTLLIMCTSPLARWKSTIPNRRYLV
jgi:hypothetical protein